MTQYLTSVHETQKFEDFLNIKSEITEKEQDINFYNDKGEFFQSKGMKTPYLGAFTRTEEAFLKHIFKTYKRKFILTHTEDNNFVDLHLFSGSSKLGTYRIDINPNTNATHNLTVQEVLKFLIKHNKKFDIILLDPPYNKRYDSQYRTRKYNSDYDDYSTFLKDLISLCKKIIANYGLLVSKNWRSISVKNFKYLTGITTSYGGFRRNTILEIFQYFPTYIREKQFNFSQKTFFTLNPKARMKRIGFLRSERKKWTENELSFIFSCFENYNFTNCIYIGDLNPPKFGLTFRKFSFYNYVKWRPKKEREGKYTLRDPNKEQYDLIIVDESSKIGGNTRATSALKILLRKEVKREGYIVIKSYFDPVLQKSSSFNSKLYESNLKSVDKINLLYDFEKSSVIHIYKKPKMVIKSEE